MDSRGITCIYKPVVNFMLLAKHPEKDSKRRKNRQVVSDGSIRFGFLTEHLILSSSAFCSSKNHRKKCFLIPKQRHPPRFFSGPFCRPKNSCTSSMSLLMAFLSKVGLTVFNRIVSQFRNDVGLPQNTFFGGCLRFNDLASAGSSDRAACHQFLFDAGGSGPKYSNSALVRSKIRSSNIPARSHIKFIGKKSCLRKFSRSRGLQRINTWVCP